eukprot:365122-Chlamydomonas_euryale.AAC.43
MFERHCWFMSSASGGRLVTNHLCCWICAMVYRSFGSFTMRCRSRSRHSGEIGTSSGMLHCMCMMREIMPSVRAFWGSCPAAGAGLACDASNGYMPNSITYSMMPHDQMSPILPS